MWVLID